MTVNKVILVGNLGRDAEIRNTASGLQLANIRLATTDRRKGADGNWQDHTEWHSIVCFDKLANLMERFGKKGKQLYVEGRLQTREYTDKDGNKRWSTEVVANEVRLLGGAGRGDESTEQWGGGGGRGGYDGGGGGGGRSAPRAPAGGGGRTGSSPPPRDDYADYGGGGGGGAGDDDIPF